MVKTEMNGKMITTNVWIPEMEDIFPVVRASKLSVNDSYLQYIPETDAQKEAKKMIICAINMGNLKDFRKPVMDPSVDEDGEIFFAKGNLPAIGFSAEWWEDKAKKLMPEKNSRIGTKKEYAAFLAVIIKTLVEEEGFKVEWAWRAVCDNSRNLGHYSDSLFGTLGVEPTGDRPVGKWFDLANTRKIIKTGAFFYSLVSGGCELEGDASPLAKIKRMESARMNCGNATGWVIMDC